MVRAFAVILLIIIITISACQQTEYTESWFNKTCQKMSYDMAIPVYIDDELTGTNCCFVDGNKADC